VFYHRHALQFDWASAEDLEGMSIGATQDYSYNEKLASLVGRGTVSVDVTTSDEANFRKLLAGRIDLFPMDPLVGMAMIDQWMTPEEAKELTFAPKPFKSSYYHVLFGHKNPRSNILRYRLNEGLRALWASGEFQEIVEKWLATEALSDNTLDLKLFRPRFDGC
jgi:polar amino acid transport system substrate-binding protein